MLYSHDFGGKAVQNASLKFKMKSVGLLALVFLLLGSHGGSIPLYSHGVGGSFQSQSHQQLQSALRPSINFKAYSYSVIGHRRVQSTHYNIIIVKETVL